MLTALFIFKDEICAFFGQDAAIQDLVSDILPILFISFIFESIQLQRQGVIRGLNIQNSAVWVTVFCYLWLGLPIGLNFAFLQEKGVEGLRAGLLISQLCLLVVYSILVDNLTNWEDVWNEAQQRFC